MIVAKLVKQFPALYISERFISVFIKPAAVACSEPDTVSPYPHSLFV
jgi:hypothetical protein